jgi:hypothetical protein
MNGPSSRPAAIEMATASRFASLALSHVTREFPNKLDHVLNGPDDAKRPRALHPVFYGSMDWHSNVHGYWLLATLLRVAPGLPERHRIRALFDGQITAAGVAGEVAYLDQPNRGTFERPYGWAWLLMLAAELQRHGTDDGRRWTAALAPLTDAFVARFTTFLPRAAYPIRAGTHFNTAFALALASEYAHVASDETLAELVRRTATAWYGEDAGCQAWEPGGDDFLSPALIEAECMGRVLEHPVWRAWMDRFLPRLVDRQPETLFAPVSVSDRSDGKIAHLDGLNLSRAWCWRSIAARWNPDDPRRAIALETAERHLAVSLPHVAGDYAGEHWLATYAMLAALVRSP